MFFLSRDERLRDSPTERSTDLTKMTLKAMQEQLPASLFFRINKSYIINTRHITSFDNNDVTIRSHEIAIGNSYRDDFFEKFVTKRGGFKKGVL
ncbi:MAG: LytTR family transcriptional regulator DNA-binding domain-containing protein [Butyricimonas paravirosa]